MAVLTLAPSQWQRSPCLRAQGARRWLMVLESPSHCLPSRRHRHSGRTRLRDQCKSL